MGRVGSNPLELEELGPSYQGSGVPHPDAEARNEMGNLGKDASELGSDFKSDCSGKLQHREYDVG